MYRAVFKHLGYVWTNGNQVGERDVQEHGADDPSIPRFDNMEILGGGIKSLKQYKGVAEEDGDG